MTDDSDAMDDESDSGFTEKMFGRIVGSVVSPVVDNVDLDELVERIDVNRMIERVDVEELIDRVDVDRVIDRVDLNAVLDGVDLNAALEQVDVNALLDRIDPDRLLDRVDPDRLLDRVDPDRLLDRVDPDRLLDRVDPDRLLDRVDPDRLLDRVDPDRLLDRVDPDRLLDRVDPDRLLDRVDPDRLLDRVDPDRLMARVDVNALVERTEIDAIISRSTTGVFTNLLDVARTQLISVDQVVQVLVARVLRGRRREAPGTPVEPTDTPDLSSLPLSERAVVLQGHWAGSVSRFLAFLIDYFVIGVLYSAGLLLTSMASEVVLGSSISLENHRGLSLLTFGLWVFVYVAGSLAATGRTIGKAILGLLTVRADGGPMRPRRASLRTICFPISFLIFGIGFLVGLVRRDRRQLHDLLAGTAVVYAWDARTAKLRADSTDTAKIG
jgi:uncharacterized RDD family membrane protein YckC